MIDLPSNKKIILFDGVCNLCNNSVITVIKNDKKNIFVFAALQSKSGKTIISKLGADIAKLDSIILYESATCYHIKSTAIIKIMNDFGGFWSITKLFFIFPESFRNLIYDFIAKNRYQWFGRKQSCMVPTSELKSKFLE